MVCWIYLKVFISPFSISLRNFGFFPKSKTLKFVLKKSATLIMGYLFPGLFDLCLSLELKIGASFYNI